DIDDVVVLMYPQRFHQVMLVIRIVLIESVGPLLHRRDDLITLAAAQLYANAVTDAIFRLLEQIQQLFDGFAVNLDRLEQRPIRARDAIDAAVRAVAAGIAQGMLQVTNDGVVPIDEPDSAVGSDLQVRRAEIRIARVNNRLDFGCAEATAPFMDLVLQDALEADDVGDQEIALIFLGKMPAGHDLYAGAGPGALLIDLGRGRVLPRIF